MMRPSFSLALLLIAAAELSTTTSAFTTIHRGRPSIVKNHQQSITTSITSPNSRHVKTTTKTSSLSLMAPRFRKSNSGLEMMSALAAVAGAISGGVFAGGLHAIAGPDHLAALLPRCVGQRWYRAYRVGALWGVGHGISATLMGVVGFLAKSRINFPAMKFAGKAEMVLEIAVGLSLVLIGAMGIKEAREWKEEIHGVVPRSLGAASNTDSAVLPRKKRAVIFNGLLHGFSWDGAPSLAPALAVATWRANLAFLLSYGIGTILMMTVATSVIGEGTSRAGEAFRRPDIPQKVSFFSSILALAIGVVWCGKAAIV